MGKTVLDIETKWVMEGKKRYPLPFHPDNKIVTVQWYKEDGKTDLVVLEHKEKTTGITSAEFKTIQGILNEATLLIGHNLKFDIMWLRECGFVVEAPIYDTMIAEYVNAKGQKIDLSLKGSAERAGAQPKKDILYEYMKNGINTDEIPLNELIEYALGDVRTTWELYQYQQEHNYIGSEAVLIMMNEFCSTLVDMERSGVSIDTVKLQQIEHQYKAELEQLRIKLQLKVFDIMGDQPFNLDSPEDLSQIVYSRAVIDKNEWKRLFNIGMELKNSVWKKKRPPHYENKDFLHIIKNNTSVLYKTIQVKCESCGGTGKVRKVKKNGDTFKKDNKCVTCDGQGVLYTVTDKIAGFKVKPKDSTYASNGGFITGNKLIAILLIRKDINDECKQFLRDYVRYNAISSYLTTFVDGIKNNVKGNILHVNFNQCVTATGRLSSNSPNFQNLPRDKTFPIRGCISSRFVGGSILDCDLAQLEFRVAAILANDKVAQQDILNGVDVHSYTSKVLTDAGQVTNRQDAKSHTFKPLYGGMSGTEAEVAYYTAFLQKYERISRWHTELSEQAITNKEIISPSGRRYSFPNCTRRKDLKASQFTQIVNYCVQGFATGDITPCIMIELNKAIKNQALKSILVLTVHDSVTADIYPGEEEIMITLFKKVFDSIPEILYNRFKLRIDIPIGYELKIGNNWSDTRKVA